MAIAGRVAIVPKGDWSADATYKRLDAVTYNNALYFAKKDVPAGTATSNTEYWSKSIVGGVGAIATTEEAGIVKPDGKSMSVDESGTLSINLDGTTITLDEAKNVIKLADTLKDAINGAFPAANVANNQITTVEGFALDARQANPNIDGSLAKQISDLNGSLNFENSPMKGKLYTIPVKGSITIPCLNCFIFYWSSQGYKFGIATTIGYQSDNVRSRISFINDDSNRAITIAYSNNGSEESLKGKYTLTNNSENDLRISVIGIKGYSFI